MRENGAGKSTLMKILIGYHQPDEGQSLLNGKPASFRSPQDAMRKGIGMIFQEGCMIHSLSILDNVFLGHEEHFRNAVGLFDKKRMREECVKILARVNLSLDPDLTVKDFAAARLDILRPLQG